MRNKVLAKVTPEKSMKVEWKMVLPINGKCHSVGLNIV
jgi:hypothetical protein